MLYKVIFFCFFVLASCKKIDDTAANINIKINLITMEYRKSFVIIEQELKRLFETQNPQGDCVLNIAINKTITRDGFSSTTFAVNQNLNFNTKYDLICNNGLKTSGIIPIMNTITLAQERTLSQYVGEKYIDEDASKRTAEIIYNEVKIFLILNKKT